jgi:electron transport complex protein RnfE
MKAYFYQLSEFLGIFIPLSVVNCIILGRAEAFASKNNPILSFVDGLGIGLGFTISLFVLGSIRELLSSGTCEQICPKGIIRLSSETTCAKQKRMCLKEP